MGFNAVKYKILFRTQSFEFFFSLLLIGYPKYGLKEVVKRLLIFRNVDMSNGSVQAEDFPKRCPKPLHSYN